MTFRHLSTFQIFQYLTREADQGQRADQPPCPAPHRKAHKLPGGEGRGAALVPANPEGADDCLRGINEGI